MTPACKCCGGVTRLFARIDFSRSCEDRRAPPFPASGQLIDYYRCHSCHFLFTPHFDSWSSEEMAGKIYNDQYILADPEFLQERPRLFAEMLGRMLLPVRQQITALDFGGGAGQLAELLRDAGFPFDAYDPYFGETAAPSGSYDLVTAFEVAEHARDPIGVFRDMLSLLRPGGVVLFSTQLQPHSVDPSWWYIAPRNGHMSIHSHKSLRAIANTLDVAFLSVGTALHLFQLPHPNPVSCSIMRGQTRPILRCASLEGLAALLGAYRQLDSLSQDRPRRDPRHIARALLPASVRARLL